MSRSSASRMRQSSMIENGERLVSAVNFWAFAILAHTIEAHARDANDESAGPVEGHAEGPAADMRVDFSSDVIRREEANDLALPHAAIEVVARVENDVFRPVDLAETRRSWRKRRRARLEQRSGRQSQMGWGHIDLGADIVPIFDPPQVDRDRKQQQHETDHHRRGAVLETEPDEPV